MKKLSFLNKMIEKGRVKETSPSEEIMKSYLVKSENCLRSSEILFENNLLENSISESYYCMYNSLLALLFRYGIKSENHAASILMVKDLFCEMNLYNIISSAKEERVDKQYYTEILQKSIVDKTSTKNMIDNAEKFLVEIKIIIQNTTNEKIKQIHEKFKALNI